MAKKVYKCIEGNGCEFNNNGWCKFHKKNGLSSVQECETYSELGLEVQPPIKVEAVKVSKSEPVIIKHESKVQSYEQQQSLLAVGRVMGKREMLLFLQRACIAKGGNLSLDDINKFNQLIMIDETIFETAEYEGMVDSDIRVASIQIAIRK